MGAKFSEGASFCIVENLVTLIFFKEDYHVQRIDLLGFICFGDWSGSHEQGQCDCEERRE